MKKLLTYYLLILAPLGIIIWLYRAEVIGSYEFIALLFFYIVIYRPITDGKRLLDKEAIPEKDLWKAFIPGFQLAYFKELYLK